MMPSKPQWLQAADFDPVIDLPDNPYVHDFSNGEDPNPTDIPYSIGRYNEERNNMYDSPLFTNDQRNIHIGIDIAAPVGTAVRSFYDGEIFLFDNNQTPGDYGPTLIVKYEIKSHELYALYGHLSLSSLDNKKAGQKIAKGDVLGWIGDENINGGWFPHLHFQISLEKPKQCDMPGVISHQERAAALATYPDPRWVLGPIYD